MSYVVGCINVAVLLPYAVNGGIPHELKYEFDALRYGDSVR